MLKIVIFRYSGLLFMPDNTHFKCYTINSVFSNYSGYNKLLNLHYKAIRSQTDDVKISITSFFNANLSALLGGILDIISKQDKKIFLNIDDDKIRDTLQRNGFLQHFGSEQIKDSKRTTIKYLKISSEDKETFNNYLLKELMQMNQLKKIDEKISKEIKRNIHEIYKNAQIHSNSDYIYVCGQYYPRRKTLEFTIVDTGIGFSGSISRKFVRTLTSEDAIRWALKSGNTTKNITGGLGLSALNEFIDTNGGELHIITGNSKLSRC